MSLRPGLTALLDGVGVPVEVGGAPDSEPPAYAVLYTSPGRIDLDSVAAAPDGMHTAFQVTSVSLRDPREAESVAERCRDALVGRRPVASGWVTGLVVHVASSPVTRDDDRPDTSVWFCTDSYEVLAARA